MKDYLLGTCLFFFLVGMAFVIAPKRVAGRALGTHHPGPEGLRGIRIGGYVIIALAVILIIFQFVSE